MLLGDREKAIDYIYGVYLSENGDKYLDIDTNNFVIVDVLYELIFKKIPDDYYLHRK